MNGGNRRKNPRNLVFAVDILHLVIGLAIVVLAVIAFLSPEKHMIFFPLIFFLASLLNLVNGIGLIRTAGRDKRRRLSGAGTIVFGVLLLVIGVVSAVSIS